MIEPSEADLTTQGIVLPSLTASAARKLARGVSTLGAAKLHAVLCQRLSAERLSAFEDCGTKPDNSQAAVLGRYWYSVAIAEALVPALHMLEVAMRNALYDAIASRCQDEKGIDLPDCWLDWSESDTLLHRDKNRPWSGDFAKVQTAKRNIRQNNKDLKTGRLIAELGFGFWTGLFASHYGQREGQDDPSKLWPDLLLVAFPNLPKNLRSRNAVAEKLTAIRRLRNRAFHHEPLWRRKPVSDLEMICESIHWIDATVAELARTMSTAHKVQEQGITGHEARVRSFSLEHFPPQSVVALGEDAGDAREDEG